MSPAFAPRGRGHLTSPALAWPRRPCSSPPSRGATWRTESLASTSTFGHAERRNAQQRRRLEDIVIIDQLWLLRQETAIVRRPSLHPLPCDRLLAAVLHDSLHKKGILKSEIIPKLWAEHDQRPRLQLLGLMAQVGRCMS